jgi:hypothetical protein
MPGVNARRLWMAFAVALGAVAPFSQAARAQSPDQSETIPVAFGADEVRLDARTRALDVSGHVHVDEPPFYLTSDALRLRRVPIGAQLEGTGRLAFCPCLGTPLAVRFSGATVAPPSDVILRDTVLEVFGVPVAWAPVFWLRSPDRFGLLAPDVAWRGEDGLFLGSGVHLPWRSGDATRGLDLRGGAYASGGVAIEAAMRTTAAATRVRWDRLRGDDGVAIDARGATAIANGDRADSVAWDVAALRGARAVTATTDVDMAARPFDRAQAQAAWRPDGWTLASGVRTVALRGSDLLDLGAGGPVAVARRADAITGLGSYDVTVEGGQVAGAGSGPTSFARTEGGVLLATRVGPLGASLAATGLGDLADDGVRAGLDGAAQARAGVALPLTRDYGSGDVREPWVHRTEPRIEAAFVAERPSAVRIIPAGRAMAATGGSAWVTGGGWSNALARWGSRTAAELDLVAGAVGDDRRLLPALRARTAVSGTWLALRADFARVVTRPSDAGGALVASARFGPATGLHVAAHVAQRDGVDPLVARALVGAPMEPASGFLAAPGWTGGARLGAPIGARASVRGGADVDLDARALVAAVGSLELHDRCRCVVVRATAAHRIGREGVDVWLSIDLPER